MECYNVQYRSRTVESGLSLIQPKVLEHMTRIHVLLFFYCYCYILTSQLNRISAEAASLGPATTLFILTYRKVFCKDETVMFDSAGRQERCSHVNPLETKARLVPASRIRKAWDRLSLHVYSS